MLRSRRLGLGRLEEETEQVVEGGETVERARGHARCLDAAEVVDVEPRRRCQEHAVEGLSLIHI
eukprot:13427963-Heterocapsa_arctica.AAC.1